MPVFFLLCYCEPNNGMKAIVHPTGCAHLPARLSIWQTRGRSHLSSAGSLALSISSLADISTQRAPAVYSVTRTPGIFSAARCVRSAHSPPAIAREQRLPLPSILIVIIAALSPHLISSGIYSRTYLHCNDACLAGGRVNDAFSCGVVVHFPVRGFGIAVTARAAARTRRATCRGAMTARRCAVACDLPPHSKISSFVTRNAPWSYAAGQPRQTTCHAPTWRATALLLRTCAAVRHCTRLRACQRATVTAVALAALLPRLRCPSSLLWVYRQRHAVLRPVC